MSGMCLALGEWWLHKGVLLNICALIASRIPCRHFVKWLARLKYFQVLVSEF